MTRYVALLRGIGPGDPRMRNENLRAVCEELGSEQVATVISSGNIVFDSTSVDGAELETRLQAAWSAKLGFQSLTIVRSRSDPEGLVASKPFGALEHGPRSYLLVTFSKHPLTVEFDLPHRPADAAYEMVAATPRELCTVTDTTSERTPDVMAWIERRFGQQVSSRTWLTVARILRKMA